MVWSAVSGGEGSGQQEQSLGDLILYHLGDKSTLDLPFIEVLLPQWEPVQVGPVVIDFSITKLTFFLFVTAIIVALLLIWTARRTRAAGRDRAPRGVPGVIEAAVLYLRNEVALANIGKGGEAYVPFVVTVFFFIAVSNLLGLLPWGASPTTNISVTATLAVMAFILIEAAGVRSLGWRGYSRTVFFWPQDMALALKIPMCVIMTPVEILGKFTKPFALAIRLFANMAAGKAVILALVGLVFIAAPVAWFVVPWLAPVLLAVAITILKLFVAFLQAYIFALLTSVFIGLMRHAH